MGFAWTKFQDFYLRLGYLKTLAFVLDASRRSALNQALERRLVTPLFEPASKYKPLWDQVARLLPMRPPSQSTKAISVSEALLAVSDCPSILFAITPETTYKILDWGRDVEFIGRGNQITERALVLRALLPSTDADRFLAGDPMAWNPFRLTVGERIFFLYHLGEIDETFFHLIDSLPGSSAVHALEANDASKLLCKAMFKFLTRVEDQVLPRETPRYRTALDLACVIADELGVTDFSTLCGRRGASRRIGRPTKRKGLTRGTEIERRTTKNADHQTIPRFEQLTDLGFLTKVRDGDTNDPSHLADRRRWRYFPTEIADRWKNGRTGDTVGPDFLQSRFAGTTVRALGLAGSAELMSDLVIARYFWRAYQEIRRPVGHTPFDSVALLGMVRAAVDGLAIEINDFHRLLLEIKQTDLLPNHAFFASGNDIDKMFVLLKNGFLEAFTMVHARK